MLLLLVAGMVGMVGMVGGLVGGRWQGSLETWVEGGHRLEGGHLQVGVDVHSVGKLLLLLSTCWLVLQVEVAAAATAWVQRVVDVVVVDAVVRVVQAVDWRHPRLLAGMTTLGDQITLARGEGGKWLSAGHRLVEVARLKSSPHRDVPVEREVDWLGQEVAQLVPEPWIAPLHQGGVVHQVLQVRELVDLGLAHLLQLDEDHLAVVCHDRRDEGRPDLTPLGGEIGPAKDDQGPR